jgi:hypothetical protein
VCVCLCVSPALVVRNSDLRQWSVFMCSVWFSGRTAVVTTATNYGAFTRSMNIKSWNRSQTSYQSFDQVHCACYVSTDVILIWICEVRCTIQKKRFMIYYLRMFFVRDEVNVCLYTSFDNMYEWIVIRKKSADVNITKAYITNCGTSRWLFSGCYINFFKKY